MSSLQQGPTLRALLEDPNLVNPPKPADDGQKKKEADAEPLFSSQSAFLGPNLWDKTLSLDFELEYMDLDEFLTENDSTTPGTSLLPELGLTSDQLGIQFPIPDSPPRLLNDVSSLPGIDPMSLLNVSQPSPAETTPVQQQPKKAIHIKRERTHSRSLSASLGEGSQLSLSNDDMNDESEDVDDIEVAVEVPIDPVDIALATVPGATEFDPRRARFSDQDLRPQPMLRKSKKVFVCDEEKDDKYWSRRKKNNVAAKRSRDARRIKENQIALRATFLEKQNEKLKEELRLSLLVNKDLVARLSKYEDTSDNQG